MGYLIKVATDQFFLLDELHIGQRFRSELNGLKYKNKNWLEKFSPIYENVTPYGVGDLVPVQFLVNFTKKIVCKYDTRNC